ncbi:MAG TPA: Hpt domain-containing protein [Holophagaceae bacterium]
MPSTDLLDLPTLQNLVDLDDGSTGLVAEMTALFREDTPRRIQELRQALALADADGFSRAAHALKGGAGAIGARLLRSQAAELEALGRGGSTQVPAGALEQLETTFQESLDALEAYIQAGSSR